MSRSELSYLRMDCARLEDRAGVAVRAFTFARRMGFAQRACWEIGIVVQELVSNLVRHAGGGHLELHAGPGVLEVIAVDAGPGIPPPVLDAPEFWSRGLGAVRRLMHEIQIDTRYDGSGTRIYTRRNVEGTS